MGIIPDFSARILGVGMTPEGAGMPAESVLQAGVLPALERLGAETRMISQWVDPSDGGGYDHAHFGSEGLLDPDAVAAGTRSLRERGGSTSLALRGITDRLPEAVDVILARESDAKKICQTDDIDAAARQLAERSILVAIKMDRSGTLLLSGGEFFQVDGLDDSGRDAMAVEALWMAGILCGHLLKRPPVVSAHLGEVYASTASDTLLQRLPDLLPRTAARESDLLYAETRELKSRLQQAGVIELCLEGHDGAGKTPVLEALQAHLRDAGIHTATLAPFTQINHRRGLDAMSRQGLDFAALSEKDRTDFFLRNNLDLYHDWAQPSTALPLLDDFRRLINQTRQSALDSGAQVILYDRHWMTILAALVEFQPLLLDSWDDRIPTFFLHGGPSLTMGRRRFTTECAFTKHQDQVRYYYELYLKLLQTYPHEIVGMAQTRLWTDADRIAKNIAQWVGQRVRH